MFGTNKLVKGHKYTTSRILEFGDFYELKKLARKENRKFKKQRRIERLVVYPVPGTFYGKGQLFILR